MDDLISRKAAIDACHNYEDGKDAYAFGCVVEERLETMPSAQPERKRGKWVHDGRDFQHGCDWIHCSVCGKRGINVPTDLTNFCPNCGSYNGGGDDEAD